MILQYPDEFLKRKSIELTKEDFTENQVIPLFKKRVELYKTNALGLAAIQIGLAARVMWIRDFGYLINPKVIWESENKIGSIESCLSVQGKDELYLVERPEKITVLYRDDKWKLQRKTFPKELSIVVCHELAHLDGLCLPDYAKKMSIKKDDEDESN